MGMQSHAGVIDSGYRGELHAHFTAIERRVIVPRGERVAQLVILQIWPARSWELVTEIDMETERGLSGHGSTGRA
jgi:dUTPase